MTFSAKGTSETFLETEKHGKIKCSGLTATGEIENEAKADNIVVKFTGCKAEKFGAGECKNKSAGEIETEKLAAKPEYVVGHKNPHEERLMDVFPQAGGKFAEFKCSSLAGTETLKVENPTAAENSLLGSIAASEVGVFLASAKIDFDQTKGVQGPQEYENEKSEKVKDFLMTSGSGPETFGPEPSGEEAEETITYLPTGTKVKIT